MSHRICPVLEGKQAGRWVGGGVRVADGLRVKDGGIFRLQIMGVGARSRRRRWALGRPLQETALLIFP